MNRYTFLDAVSDMSSVMRLAVVKGITEREAAKLVVQELGWSEDGPSEEWKAPYQRHRKEETSYQICMAIKEVAESLGAPIDPMRLFESAA